MMKKISFVLILIGIFMIIAFSLADLIRFGQLGEIGAAQILGIDAGAILILVGIGLLTVTWSGEENLRKYFHNTIIWIMGLPPSVWIVSTFLVLVVPFFVFPVFFSKQTIQYLVKYIPDAFVTQIGRDIEFTLGLVYDWVTLKQSPYPNAYFYSPLTLILFAPLLVLGYPGYFKFNLYATLFFYVISTLLIPIFIVPKKNYNLVLLFFVTGLFSYGFQFELERGQFNVIAFALCFLAIYIYHYQPKFRYFAYILFSISIQLKIYPVFFTVMFIRDWRDWKNNIRRILGLGIFNFSFLFILGYQIFMDFVRNLTVTQLLFQSSRREDLSIKGYVYNLVTDGFGVLQPSLVEQLAEHANLIETFFLLLFFLCLFSVLMHAYFKNQKGMNSYLLLICAIGSLIIPSASVDYKLPLLIAPLAILYSSLPTIQGYKRKILSIVLIIVSALSYWSTLYPFTVKPYILSRNFPALFILLVSITSLYFLVSRKRDENQLISS